MTVPHSVLRQSSRSFPGPGITVSTIRRNWQSNNSESIPLIPSHHGIPCHIPQPHSSTFHQHAGTRHSSVPIPELSALLWRHLLPRGRLVLRDAVWLSVQVRFVSLTDACASRYASAGVACLEGKAQRTEGAGRPFDL